MGGDGVVASGCPEVDGATLGALLDGALAPDECARVEEHVRRCTICSGDLARQRLAQRALHTAARDLAASAALRSRVKDGLQSPRRFAGVRRIGGVRRAIAAAGLAAAIATVSILALWQLGGSASHTSMAAQIARAHRQETLGATPVTFASANPATVAGWVHAQTGRNVEVPDFTSAGYTLLGVRTESTIEPGAVSLVYTGAGGRVTCMVLSGDPSLGAAFSPVDDAPSVRTTRQSGVTEAVWLEPGTTYLMASELRQSALLPLISAFNTPTYTP